MATNFKSNQKNSLDAYKKEFESLGGDWSNVTKMQDLINQGYSEEEAIAKYKEDSSVPGYKEDAAVDLETFQNLLGKLESSKKRQQRQKSVEGRRDIFAQGLASMMSNF